MTKARTPTEMSKGQSDNTNNVTKKFDYTAVAATKNSDLGGTTLHKWAGIADGRFLNAEILHLINTDERYQDVKQCIVSVDCLIVDEVSRISAKTLNQVEFLCRSIRESHYKFGGMKVSFAGDFYQLLPPPGT